MHVLAFRPTHLLEEMIDCVPESPAEAGLPECRGDRQNGLLLGRVAATRQSRWNALITRQQGVSCLPARMWGEVRLDLLVSRV